MDEFCIAPGSIYQTVEYLFREYFFKLNSEDDILHFQSSDVMLIRMIIFGISGSKLD